MKLARLARLTVGSALLLSFTAALSGCGEGGHTVKVSGTVTFDGKPLDQGKIAFRSPGKNVAPQTGEIKGGKYECTALVGKQTVDITAFKSNPKAESTGIGQQNYIPEKYNGRSELTADVADSGANEFNFDLRSR